MTKRKRHHATEQLPWDDVLAGLPAKKAHAKRLTARLEHIGCLSPGAAVVEIGAAQGGFLIALSQLGFRCVGIEPWAEARQIAQRLAEHENVPITILDGRAESLPLESRQFDGVIANSVIEHVSDAQAALNEAYRVLKPGGFFWFYTASSMCPCQREISGFPLFGWSTG